jgi:hypothetical protein
MNSAGDRSANTAAEPSPNGFDLHYFIRERIAIEVVLEELFPTILSGHSDWRLTLNL